MQTKCYRGITITFQDIQSQLFARQLFRLKHRSCPKKEYVTLIMKTSIFASFRVEVREACCIIQHDCSQHSRARRQQRKTEAYDIHFIMPTTVIQRLRSHYINQIIMHKLRKLEQEFTNKVRKKKCHWHLTQESVFSHRMMHYIFKRNVLQLHVF